MFTNENLWGSMSLDQDFCNESCQGWGLFPLVGFEFFVPTKQ